MEFFGLIYKATNKNNGKIYIGQTQHNFKSKIGEYKNLAEGLANSDSKPSRYFERALKKYTRLFGFYESFDWEWICSSAIQKDKKQSILILNDLETFFIKFYDSTNRQKGYNINPGGSSFSDYVKRKISNTLIKKFQLKSGIQFPHINTIEIMIDELMLGSTYKDISNKYGYEIKLIKYFINRYDKMYDTNYYGAILKEYRYLLKLKKPPKMKSGQVRDYEAWRQKCLLAAENRLKDFENKIPIIINYLNVKTCSIPELAKIFSVKPTPLRKKLRSTFPEMYEKINKYQRIRGQANKIKHDFSGKNNPFYGKKHTKDSKIKLSNKLKLLNKDCSGLRNGFYGKTHSKESKTKHLATRLKNLYEKNICYGVI